MLLCKQKENEREREREREREITHISLFVYFKIPRLLVVADIRDVSTLLSNIEINWSL